MQIELFFFMCYYIRGDVMTIGIICEYNPFHNGHLYHINKIKKMHPNSTIILVMSGNFTQRGDISIINKWDKTDIALYYGIDLVVELPFKYATQSADTFAYGAINILKQLKVNKLIFGSEENDIDKLINMANIQLSLEYQSLVKNYLNEGLNYPTATSKAFSKSIGYTIDSPNDLLGLSYIKEIIKQKTNIEPITIKRTNDYHSTKLEKICSATSIRLAIKNNKDIKKYIPKYVNKFITNPLFIDDYYDLIKYKIISENNLSIYQSVDEGIDKRLKKYILECNSLEEFISKIKTKRYTYNRIKRMIIHILVGYTKEDNETIKDYIRVLGFNKKGKKHLNNIKKDIELPIITNYSNSKGLLNKDYQINSILTLKMSNDEKNNFLKRELQEIIIK